MQDVRGLLARSKTVKQVTRPGTGYATIHWNGPSVGAASDLALLQADARFHVNTRGWDGLSYHFAAGRQDTWQMRDRNALLAHSGVKQGNNLSLSYLVITGDGDLIAQAQYDRLEQLLAAHGHKYRYVLGHQEWPRLTACPGPLLMRWLTAKRASFREAGQAKLKLTANVRDEANVLSHKTSERRAGTTVEGTWVLGKPFKGDCLWFQLKGSTDYIHASVLEGKLPIWAIQSAL